MRDAPRLDRWSVLGYTALGAMCLVWVGAGWYIILTGGYYSTARYTRAVTYVGGFAGLAMAFLFLSLAAISTAAILKRLCAPRSVATMAAVAILGFPVGYLVAPVFR